MTSKVTCQKDNQLILLTQLQTISEYVACTMQLLIHMKIVQEVTGQVIGSNNIHDLSDTGIQYLLDRDGNVLATFTDGMMNVDLVKVSKQMAEEITAIAA